jgi:hypothetical protein
LCANPFRGDTHLNLKYLNGLNYGAIDVANISLPQAGYLFLIGGDRSGGDYVDNIKVQELPPRRK